MTVTINDIMLLMETLAPPRLAEKWDNCGLQLGKREWPVSTVLTALDPLPEVIEEAIRLKVNMLITHHPLLFGPVKSIDLDTPIGAIIARALEGKMGIYAAHTNLDSMANGLNDWLALRLGIRNLTALQPASGSAECNTESGSVGPQGLGRKGELESSTTLKTFALSIKDKLGLSHITIIGDPDLPIRNVALCSGSGSSLLNAFYMSEAQVFISGDFRYHDAREVEMRNLGLIDIGHFPSEHLMVDALQARLKKECNNRAYPIEIHASKVERNPFVIL